MKKGWDKYAIESRYVKKGYLRKYRNGNPSWKAPEASSCDSVQQIRKVQEEVNGWVFNGPPLDVVDYCYGTVLVLTEKVFPIEPLSKDDQLALDIFDNCLQQVSPILKERDERTRACEERTGTDGDSSGRILDMRPVPKKRIRRGRKAEDHKTDM